jgi:hypothetical protein
MGTPGKPKIKNYGIDFKLGAEQLRNHRQAGYRFER